MQGCDSKSPDGHFDTKIDNIEIHHILMSYTSYVIKCHIMTYDAYDIQL